MDSVDRRRFIQLTGAGAAGLALAESIPSLAHGAAPARPNIILLMADDLGAETLGCYGGESYKTPSLDELARSGVRFDYCYCTPLCTPTRVQIMTGRYPFRTGFTELIDRKGDHFLDPSKEITFAHVMQKAGYATAIAGKWQLCDFSRHPNLVKECGFDEYCCWAWIYDGKETERYHDPVIWQNGEMLKDTKGKYGPDIHLSFLKDFIRRNSERPFLAYYPICLPHLPLHHPPGADASSDRFTSMVEYVDAQVGDLVRFLEELNIRENTLVLFTADNGTPRGIETIRNGKAVMGGKNMLTEIGAHVPLIASWQGAAPGGRTSGDLIDVSDVLPTLAELGGAEVPGDRPLDGRSFAPQLRGRRGRRREWVYVQLREAWYVFDGRWMLYSDGRLFDLKADPDQAFPLADGQEDKEAARARKRLAKALAELRG